MKEREEPRLPKNLRYISIVGRLLMKLGEQTNPTDISFVILPIH